MFRLYSVQRAVASNKLFEKSNRRLDHWHERVTSGLKHLDTPCWVPWLPSSCQLLYYDRTYFNPCDDLGLRLEIFERYCKSGQSAKLVRDLFVRKYSFAPRATQGADMRLGDLCFNDGMLGGHLRTSDRSIVHGVDTVTGVYARGFLYLEGCRVALWTTGVKMSYARPIGRCWGKVQR